MAADASSIAGINGSSEEKLALNRPGIKQEKWTTILLQVSIPFFLAGIGTIGAGIVLGRVEVSPSSQLNKNIKDEYCFHQTVSNCLTQ